MARQPRRSIEQWKELVDQHKASSLSAAELYRRRKIGYRIFMAGRKRVILEPLDLEASFVELRQPELSPVEYISGSALLIELDLASGIQLRISCPGWCFPPKAMFGSGSVPSPPTCEKVSTGCPLL